MERKLDYAQLEKFASDVKIDWMNVPYALEDFEDAMEHELKIHPDFTNTQVAMIARDCLNAYGAEYIERIKHMQNSIDY